MNPQIEKLIKIQKRAAVLANQRDTNETKFQKAYEAARKSPEWKAYCQKNGVSESYNYGDVIC